MPRWSALEPSVNERFNRTRAALLAYSKTTASTIEADMKRNAPWTDRTGNARNRLFSRAFEVTSNPDVYEIGVQSGHGVSYGIWLEVRWSGRWAIVGPTVKGAGPRYFSACRRLVRTGLGRR